VRAYFVTGTDTGVGKTAISIAILTALRRRGLGVAALKPAETGCRVEGGVLLGSDGIGLRAAAGLEDVPLDVIAPHRYQTPVAPAVAARLEERPFSLPRVLKCRDTLVARAPHLFLVEGAGGLLVPYVDDFLGADLAAALGLPLLIVARAGLGTINHTLLTVAEARRRGLAIAGVILNRSSAERGISEDTNAGEIERLGDVRVLGLLPYVGPEPDAGALADMFTESVSLDDLV
jgi:dethiobiotin synthetase